MQVSIGIYALIFIFFLLIIPGFLARRAYYNGEFSKEINWSRNTFSNFLSSLLVGIITVSVFVLIYNLISTSKISFDGILNLLDTYFIGDQYPRVISIKKRFDGFTEVFGSKYLPFIGFSYFFSLIIGFLFNRIVMTFDLDIKFKLLRFSNNWHYLTSGRILRLEKVDLPSEYKKYKVKNTFFDILVAENGDKTTLYSGLHADYEVSSVDVNKLEKIHLLQAARYKKNEEGMIERKEIPGNLFTIMGDRILNINTTYICYSETEFLKMRFKPYKIIFFSFQILRILTFFFMSGIFIFSLKIFSNEWFNYLLIKNWFYKLVVLLSINILLGLAIPFKLDNENFILKFIGWPSFLTSFFGFLLILLILLVFFSK